MPIRFVCKCGHRLVTPGKFAGRRGKCPACGATVTIPRAAAEETGSQAPAARPAAEPSASRRSAPAAEVSAAPASAGTLSRTARPPASPAPAAAVPGPEAGPSSAASGGAAEQSAAKSEPSEEDLLDLLRNFLPQEGYFVAPEIPEKKLRNARERCQIPSSDRVLALVDCTVFGSAKNCLAFAASGAYFHNDPTNDPRKGHIPYAEFAKRLFGEGGFKTVGLGAGQQLDVSGASCPGPKVLSLLQAVQRVVTGQGTALVPRPAAVEPAGDLRPYAGDQRLVKLAMVHLPDVHFRVIGGAFWSTTGTAAGRVAKTVALNVVGAVALGALGIGFFGVAGKKCRAGLIGVAGDELYLMDMGQVDGNDLTFHQLKSMGSPTVARFPLSAVTAGSSTENGMGVLQIQGEVALKAVFSDSCTDGNSSAARALARAIQAVPVNALPQASE